MQRVAIIGGGAAGLTAAHLLKDACDVTLFEADGRLGGHAHTVEVSADGVRRGVDTGFLVFNERTYPLFTRLLARLGVATQTTTVSFAMRDDAERVEYGSHDPRTALSQPRNLLRLEMHRVIRDVLRARAAIRRWEHRRDATLGQFLDAEGFGHGFQEFIALPLTATVWSVDYRRARDFPFQTWWAFLRNHGLGAVFDPPPWKSFPEGSRAYVRAIGRGLGDRARLRAPVARVERVPGGVRVTPAGAEPERFDHAVLACHTDQALRLLAATDAEARALSDHRLQPERGRPPHRHLRAPEEPRGVVGWNYLRGVEATGPTVTYNLNVLHRIRSEVTYGASLNETSRIDPARVLGRFDYAHPVFDHAAFDAADALRALSGRDRVWFAGGYLGMGFHEDCVRSANEVVRALAPLAGL